MPYITLRGSFDKNGEAAAMLSEIGGNGAPDHKRKVPVRVRRINEHVLAVDGENRRIIGAGVATVARFFWSMAPRGMRRTASAVPHWQGRTRC